MPNLTGKLAKIPHILKNEGLSGIYWRLAIRLRGDTYLQQFQHSYEQWYHWHKPTNQQLAEQQKLQSKWSKRPLISILLPTYNTNPQFLRECIDSVLAQSYPNWELCIVDDASTTTEVKQIVESYQDKRIKVKFRKANGHIAVATNDALIMAKGEWVALLDHDDYLWPNALFEVVKKINTIPSAQLIYSDEDKIAEDGFTHCDPFFKPDWSPHFLWSCNYITHFACLKTALIRSIGNFRQGTEGAQDWDLFLRAAEMLNGYRHHPWQKNCPIQHVDTILYSWRKSATSTASEKFALSAKSYAYQTQIDVLEKAVKEQGGGKVNRTKYIGLYQVLPSVKSKPKISIIIPTKNNFSYLKRCLESIHTSTYPNYDILLIDTGSDRKELAAFVVKQGDRVHLHKWHKQFNFSAVSNYGANQTDADVLVFLNDDTVIKTANWLESMLAYTVRSEVGAVGVRLTYPTGLLQHNGLILGKEEASVLGVKGFVSNYFRLQSPYKNYGIASLYLENIRDYSAVTAACLMIEHTKHDAIRGFDPAFQIAFNDVDYCLKLNQKGLFNVLIPQVTIEHAESVSLGRPDEKKRDLQLFANELKLMRDRWGERLSEDSFSNKHLKLENAVLFCRT